jgi:hypothetical protein
MGSDDLLLHSRRIESAQVHQRNRFDDQIYFDGCGKHLASSYQGFQMDKEEQNQSRKGDCARRTMVALVIGMNIVTRVAAGRNS